MPLPSRAVRAIPLLGLLLAVATASPAIAQSVADYPADQVAAHNHEARRDLQQKHAQARERDAAAHEKELGEQRALHAATRDELRGTQARRRRGEQSTQQL